mgnify:CR=1 FL=1
MRTLEFVSMHPIVGRNDICTPIIADRMTDTCPLVSSSLPILQAYNTGTTGYLDIEGLDQGQPHQVSVSRTAIGVVRMQLVLASVCRKRV